MTIEEVIANLWRAEVTGKHIHHLLDNISYPTTYVITTSQFAVSRSIIFRHKKDYAAGRIPVNISLMQAIEIVKKYWDRRIDI